MTRAPKGLIVKSATVLVALAICLAAYLATRPQPAGAAPWYSIVPPLVAISLALITNRLFLSLIVAVLTGGLLSAMGDCAGDFSWLVRGAGQAATFVVQTVYQVDGFEFDIERFNISNIQILLFVTLIMPMISVMLVSGGLQGVARWLIRFARSARSTQLVTMISGLVIFIDDYANTMIVGPTMRPVTDQQRISREKLAFLVDATAAPVAGIALVSTWIGFEVTQLSNAAQPLGITRSGYEMFLDALGSRFYCMGMIAFVFFNAWSGRDFGPMAAAERRARKQGKVLADDATPMTSQSMISARPHPKARMHASAAVIPMVVLLVAFLGRLWFDGGGAFFMASDPMALLRLSVWREACSTVSSPPLLVFASGCALLVAIGLAQTVARVPVSALARALVAGLKSSLLPLTVLVLAWSLGNACHELNTGKFLAKVLGELLSPMIFPALVFVVASLTSFATGTSYGTMIVLIPAAMSLAFELDGRVYGPVTMISIGAVLDGAIFGDHCSPISDTTIMSSTASSCDHLAHVRTQLPYSLVVAAVALCLGYLPAAIGVPKWLSHLTIAALFGLLFLGLRMPAMNKRD